MGGGEPGRQRDEPGTQAEAAAQADRDRLARLRLMSLGLQLGGTIVGSLILFLAGGIWLDGHFHTSPLFLLIGLALAFIAIGYNLYELATVKMPPRRTQPKPTTTSPSSAAWDAWDEQEKNEDDEWPARRGVGGKGKEG